MNRQQFLEEALPFASWAGKFECDRDGHLEPASKGALSELVVSLDIGKSSKVPRAIRSRVPFHQLTRWYSWRANGMTTGDFAETRATVEGLVSAITSTKTGHAAIAAVQKILLWGGDRNARVGAMPFLAAQADLVGYLEGVKEALTLNTAVISPEKLGSVQGMNSMLTKIHAFNSNDGLPIYDSRVAGAVATLIETWRRAAGSYQPLPAALSFPSVGGGGDRRSVQARYDDCIAPVSLPYVGSGQPAERALRNARAWASAKVRLGWLLSELLVKPNPAGIRSLEACLFMAGYDCASINR